MLPKENNTFCYFPFHQIALKKWNEGGIYSAAPCCNSLRPENPDPLQLENKLENMTHEEIFHSPVMNTVRKTMLEGKKHPACATCWKMEEKGVKSYRMHSYSTNDSIITMESLKTPQLSCIDFSFGDNCNLRCRMCQPGLSNKLRIDYKHFAKKNADTNDIAGFERNIVMEDRIKWLQSKSENEVLYWQNDSWQWKNILDNIHKLTKLKASGGETTITKPFLEFINKAIEIDHAKNVSLLFHTNATKFTDDLLDKLSLFKSLELNFSIDSYGKNYEYIRYPMTWKALDKSVRNFFNKTKFSNSKIYIQFTNVLSCLNAFNLHEIYSYYKELSLAYPNSLTSFWVDFIWPESKFINVKFLPKDLKLELIEYYKQTFQGYQYPIQHIIQYLENNLDLVITDTHRQNMLREITLFDDARSQHYRDFLDPRICKFLETEIK